MQQYCHIAHMLYLNGIHAMKRFEASIRDTPHNVSYLICHVTSNKQILLKFNHLTESILFGKMKHNHTNYHQSYT